MRYRIEADSVHGLAERMVYLMKVENETGAGSIEKLEVVCSDGSKVRVGLSKKPKDPTCRHGIEIDGARLG